MSSDIDRLDAAGAAFWTVTRCGHDRLHLHLGRLTLTLSAEELRVLRDLLARAETELLRQAGSGPH